MPRVAKRNSDAVSGSSSSSGAPAMTREEKNRAFFEKMTREAEENRHKKERLAKEQAEVNAKTKAKDIAATSSSRQQMSTLKPKPRREAIAVPTKSSSVAPRRESIDVVKNSPAGTSRTCYSKGDAAGTDNVKREAEENKKKRRNKTKAKDIAATSKPEREAIAVPTKSSSVAPRRESIDVVKNSPAGTSRTRCSKDDAAGTDNYQQVSNLEPSLISDQDKEERRLKRFKAAKDRKKAFNQGGGGVKLKKKQKRVEDAERKNNKIGGGNVLKWNGDAS